MGKDKELGNTLTGDDTEKGAASSISDKELYGTPAPEVTPQPTEEPRDLLSELGVVEDGEDEEAGVSAGPAEDTTGAASEPGETPAEEPNGGGDAPAGGGEAGGD